MLNLLVFGKVNFVSIFRNMIINNLWPENLTYISCDDYDGHNTPSRQGLNLRRAFKNVCFFMY